MEKKTNKLQSYGSKIESVLKYIPSKDLLSTITLLAETYKEDVKARVEIERIDAKKDLLIKEMDKKYELYYRVFGEIFSERRQGIDKSFEIIDKGIKENDKELISAGLGSLSQIVSTSPFSNLKELSELLNSGGTIEI